MYVIRQYEGGDQKFVIDGLVDLQDFEASLHESRHAPERDFCIFYLENALKEAEAKNGAFLIATSNSEKVGFVG